MIQRRQMFTPVLSMLCNMTLRSKPPKDSLPTSATFSS
jgi:hypothetical protein